jgi:hypothetical protein
VKSPPALTCVKVPAGGVLWPRPFHPQQASVPSVFSPQVWLLPAVTWVKVPAGGVLWPPSFRPQQATVPSVLRPQV